MKHYNSIVIGAGPSGLSAALYLARFGLSVALVEKLTPGGLLLQTSDIDNYPGFPQGIQGYALADALSEQLAPYPVDRIIDEVAEVDLASTPKRIRIGQDWFSTDTLIICSGVQYRRLGLPDEERFIGKGISNCALCDGNFFRGQPVAVVGGGNSALDEALYLSRLVSDLYLIHRRDAFRGAQFYQDKLKERENIHILYDSVVSGIHGGDGLESLTVTNVKDKSERELKVNGLFVFIGFVPMTAYLPKDALQVDEQGFLITDTEMRTNVPGVFAAGDIRSKLCRQIATAVGDGVTAANSVHQYLESHHG